jgi:hypothetical protein
MPARRGQQAVGQLGPAGEAGGDHQQRAHAVPAAVLGGRRHGFGRHAQHRQVDHRRQLADGWHGRHTLDGVRVRVHHVHGAGEAAGEQVAQQRVADGVAAAAGADHDHRRRPE